MYNPRLRSLSPNTSLIPRGSFVNCNEEFAYAFENTQWLQKWILNSNGQRHPFQRIKNKKLIRFDDKLELPEMKLIKSLRDHERKKTNCINQAPISLVKVINDIICKRTKDKVSQAKKFKFKRFTFLHNYNKKTRILSCSPKRSPLMMTLRHRTNTTHIPNTSIKLHQVRKRYDDKIILAN